MLNTEKMQLKWHQILYFHVMCVGLTLSQNVTSDGLPAEPFILYSNTTNLRSLDLVSFAQANVLGGQNRIIPLGVDTVYQHIYFGDFNLGRISRSNYDGSNVSIIMEKVKQVEGLAVDWINRLMYWTKYPSATIEVATLDGLYRTVLINTGIQYPRGMAVDPIAGYFFWSDWGPAAAIERSFLDGSNRVTLVTNNITWPNGVTLDTSQRLVYWTDGNRNEISSVDYDGNNRRLIFEYSSLPFHYGHVNAFDLDISGDYLYFSEWSTNAIYEVKISSGTLVRYIYVPTIHSMREVMGLRVIHSAKQQAGTSNCGNDKGGCEQLCFHKVATGTSCGCQLGMKLASDGMSCEHNVSNGGPDNFNQSTTIPSTAWLTSTNVPTSGTTTVFIVNINMEINLSNKKFNEELKNKSSPAYKELKDDVYIELYKVFNNTKGFEDVDILGFVNGSVKVLFRVIFKVFKPSKEANDAITLKVGEQIYKQLKTGRIGKFTVIASTFKLKAEPPPPANVSYSDVRETKVDIFWDPPKQHQLFSIKRYYISYLKHGEKKWSNDTVGAYDDKSISFQVDNLDSDTFYTLKVTAENDYYLGKESKRMEIKTLKVKVVSPWYYIGPVIAVACVVLLVAVACLVRRVSLSDAWRPAEDGRFHWSEKEGKTTFKMIDRGQQYQNTYTNPAFSNTLAKPSWQEIERILIEVSDETLIPGEFGIKIVRGAFSCVLGKNKEACSIKLLKENGTAEDHRELMNELKTISTISNHENIVNLIGACTSEDGPLLLVLEFCPRGTLESNLRESDKKREMFINKNKIGLANEIAKGMRHLADSRIVYRDLAAKNILMTADFTPKISNLGFCRDIYEESLYQKLIPGKLSTPWLAIESLTDGLYTTKSDVWSFAVVMWEIETGGDIPYQEYEVAKLVNQLKKGHRLLKPDDTSDDTYKLMLQCWNENPNNRPTFQKIVEIIQMHLVNYEF